MNWLFFIAIAFLILSAVLGYRKGFVKIAYSLLSSIVALLLVGLLAPHVQTLLIEKTPVYEKTVEICTAQIQEKIDKAAAEAGENVAVVLEESDIPIPESMQSLVGKMELKEEYTASAAQQAGATIANWIVLIISFVLTYIVVIIGLKILEKTLDLATKLPVLKGTNKWLGLMCGLVQGVIDLWLAALILSSVCTTPTGSYLVSLVNENVFLKFIYDYNGIIYIVTLFSK